MNDSNRKTGWLFQQSWNSFESAPPHTMNVCSVCIWWRRWRRPTDIALMALCVGYALRTMHHTFGLCCHSTSNAYEAHTHVEGKRVEICKQHCHRIASNTCKAADDRRGPAVWKWTKNYVEKGGSTLFGNGRKCANIISKFPMLQTENGLPKTEII